MNELINLKGIWDQCVEKWRTSFGCILIAVLAFWAGNLVMQKSIVDDCKFAKVFRDGPYVYECNARIIR